MKMKKYILKGLLIAAFPFFTGCDDLFRDMPVDRMSETAVWENSMLLDEYVLPWYRNMNHGFSTYVPTTITLLKGASRYYMPWFGDQITVSKTDYFNAGYGDLLKGNTTEITRWALVNWNNYYTQIQSVNRLLENQDKIAEGEQKQRLLGEAHFFRAYYYYVLWRFHGGVFLIENTYDPLENPQQFPRASYEEMVNYITAEADRAAALLPLEYDAVDKGRVTKGAAMMLKAKAYLWAAGPKFQGQEKAYLGFPDDCTEAMLKAAQKAYEDLMGLDYYSLVPVSGTTQDEIKKGYRNIFLTKNSQESILEVQHSDDGDYSTGFGHKLDRDAAAPSFTGTTALYTPTQNHVDEYGMREGTVYDAQNPYQNRDYRFYANILYDGAEYRGHVMDIHYTKVGREETAGADLTAYGTSTTAAVTMTGYYLGKFVDESQQIDNNDTYASKQNCIIWRYAEVLLDYAEVMFRLGDTETARQYVNKTRVRAHMYELPSLTWDEYVRERRVEMAFEETTYWDLLRWGIAVERMSGETNPLKVMKIVKEEGQADKYTISNMNRFPKRVRVFNDLQYYLPIPWDELRYQGAEQNPEWVEV